MDSCPVRPRKVPISMTGKTICMFTMLSGILVIALPVTVIGQNFSTIYAKDLEEKVDPESPGDVKARKGSLPPLVRSGR